MKNVFPSVWYASEKRVKSISKFTVFDEGGSLDISDNEINFIGGKSNIKINKENVKNISLVTQKINWVTYLIVNILLIVYIIFFQKDVIVFFAVLVVANFFGLLVAFNTKWVLVEYIEENNKLNKVYFADSSKMGWGGIFGGTKKIFDSMKS